MSTQELGRQAAKSRATQDKIINAVISLIKEKGFSAASSAAIASRAGVTWGAVQHHFGGKEDILDEILKRSYQKYFQVLTTSQFSIADPGRRVSRYIDITWKHYQAEDYMASLEILLAMRGSGRASHDLPISASGDELLAQVESVFNDSKVSSTIMLEMIYLVHCMLTGLLIGKVLEAGSFTADSQIRRLKSIVKDMLY